ARNGVGLAWASNLKMSKNKSRKNVVNCKNTKRMRWRCRVSNPVPLACKASALPFELHPHLMGLKLEQFCLVKQHKYFNFQSKDAMQLSELEKGMVRYFGLSLGLDLSSSIGVGRRRGSGLVVRAGKAALCLTKRNRSRKSLARTHGFRRRLRTTGGRAMLKRRRAKGRKILCTKTNPNSGKRA
ncbi:unnamed protein product, partial [Prunus brigantina]